MKNKGLFIIFIILFILSASAAGTTSTTCPSNRESFSAACSFSGVTASLTSAVPSVSQDFIIFPGFS